MTQPIQSDSAVLVHFMLFLSDGSLVESTRDNGKPALFTLGDGSLSPALETQLTGLAAGDKRRFTLQPDQSFGESNPDLIQYFSIRDFAETGIPEVGTIMLFSAMDGSDMPGIIRDITGESITVDFNHPLAGQEVTFEIEILSVNPPLEQETINANLAG